MMVGSGVVDSLASKFTVSPTLISCLSALILALGVVELSAEHPTRLVASSITMITQHNALGLLVTESLRYWPLIGLLESGSVL